MPKEAMNYPDFPFSAHIRESYLSHKQVLEYLESFATHYRLHQYIKVSGTTFQMSTMAPSVGSVSNFPLIKRKDFRDTVSMKQCFGTCHGNKTI